MAKLGFSFGSRKEQIPRTDILNTLLELNNEVVEIGFVDASRLEQGLTKEEIEIIKQFKYISLHAPAVVENFQTGEKRFLSYSKPKTQNVINLIQQLRKQVNLNTVLFHPDTIEDFDWLSAEFGEVLAFENMDKNKNFGKTIEDMEKVFERCPWAKWVCDVNHIYTIDPTMRLAREFYQKLGERLCHYHLSAYGGFHAPFLDNPKEIIILEGIINKNVPIVHEGGATKRDLDFIRKEYELVSKIIYN